jgi:hypothetical protein
MNIDIEFFIVVGVIGALFLLCLSFFKRKEKESKLDLVPAPALVPVAEEVVCPSFFKKKEEESKLDPVPTPAAVAPLEPVVNKAQEEVKVNIDAKTEEIFVKVMEEAARVEKPVEEVLKEVVATVEPAKVVTSKVKKPAAKKAPAKKVTKK